MSNKAYSDLKAAWHLPQISTMRSGGIIVPKQVHFIISDLCNQNCHFCAYRMDGGLSTEQFREDGNINPNRKIDTAKCFEILDDCAAYGVKAIQFTGGGEPTVHPEHIAVIRHAQEMGLETALVTNGMILAKGWEEAYERMAWIRVSVDAGTPETYASVRETAPTNFEKVLRNIARIRNEITEATLLGAGFVATPENYTEIPLAAQALREAGASYVRVAAMFSDAGTEPYADIHDKIKTEIAAARAYECSTFKVVDLFGDRIADLEQQAPDYEFCGYQQFVTYIGGNLKVYRCCSTSYTEHGEIGDLTHQTFGEWLISRQRTNAMQKFNARSCQTCQFNGKNRVINDLIDQEPLHVNFV